MTIKYIHKKTPKLDGTSTEVSTWYTEDFNRKFGDCNFCPNEIINVVDNYFVKGREIYRIMGIHQVNIEDVGNLLSCKYEYSIKSMASSKPSPINSAVPEVHAKERNTPLEFVTYEELMRDYINIDSLEAAYRQIIFFPKED